MCTFFETNTELACFHLTSWQAAGLMPKKQATVGQHNTMIRLLEGHLTLA